MSTKKGKKLAGKKHGDAKKNKKSKMSAKKAAREAKKAARKGDGSFPDVMVVTKWKDPTTGVRKFVGHDDKLSGLDEDGAEVAVYKLRRVSTVKVSRKVVR
jgi:hypothetical protein